SHHRSGAFTLIELLVVITIIAILASVSVPMGKMVMDKARRASAANDCQQLTNAISSYYTEYNRYPTTSQTDEGPYEADRNIMDILMAETENGEARTLKPREIAFYEPGKIVKDLNVQGLVEGVGQLNDPWGKMYEIYMDVDDDGSIQVPAIYGNKYGTGGTVR